MTTPSRVGLGRCSIVTWNTMMTDDFNLDENDVEESDDYNYYNDNSDDENDHCDEI